ncbi:MAG: hypothetical protein CMO66_07495 [Verrucomicrobiales bacterium]|nr:hypothetical protein [Verrucomicrobiales bacterium]
MRNTKLFKALTSLKLTVTTLSLSMVVVFLGTMAQENMGLKMAVDRYFKSFFIDHIAIEAAWNKTTQLFGSQPDPLTPEELRNAKRWPVFPGGYLLGTVLLVNLLSAYYARFKWTWSKLGILATHVGIVMLLVGQLLTDLLSVESFLSLRVGDRKNYSESFDYTELAFVSSLNSKSNQVMSVPGWKLRQDKKIADPTLGNLELKVNQYWVNGVPQGPRSLADAFKMRQPSHHGEDSPAAMAVDEFKAFARDQDPPPRTVKDLKALIDDFGRVDRRLTAAEWLGIYQNQRGQGGDFVIRMITGQIAEFIATRGKEGPLTPREMANECRRFVEALKHRENPPDENVLRNLTSLINDVAAFCQQRDMTRFVRDFSAFVEDKKLQPSGADSGLIAKRYPWVEESPESLSMDSRNLPVTSVELVDNGKSLGTYLFSARMISQEIEIGGKDTKVSLRPKRHYHNLYMTLIKLQFEKYRGTDIPKNFESRTLVEPSNGGASRVVDIYMNHPLRYEGDTFYQYQMDSDQMRQASRSSAFQVVENPNWLTPYLGCLIVAFGLVYQFMAHLVGFVKKRKAA